MFKIRVLFLFIIHLIVSNCISQEFNPFVVYDFDNDIYYNSQLIELKKEEKNYSSKKIISSIAELSYYYKDWDTAMDYFKKVIIENPSAENHFKLGVAAARKSLEISKFFSIPYIVQARKSVLRAHQLIENKPKYLKLLIKLYAEVPSVFGGDIEFAKKKADELLKIDSIQGFIMQGYINDLNKNKLSAKLKYKKAFFLLENKPNSIEDFFIKSDRNLVFEIGRAVANHRIFNNLGLSALRFYANSYNFMDNYPLASVYFNLSKIYFNQLDIKNSIENIKIALKLNPNLQSAMNFKKKHDL